jgi:hypothetical protein
MSDRPDVIPLYPQGRPADEADGWRRVFTWIAARPPADWRQNPAARALIAAAEQFISPVRRRLGA